MRYYIIAGEKSGDMQGAQLMQAIKQEDPKAIFRYWGGHYMQQEGGTLVVSYTALAVMGLAFLGKLMQLWKYLKFCKKDILQFQPDVVILIDYAGFNLRIAKFAKKQGIKTFYYIAPKVWAWNPSRTHQIKAYVDRLFTIFPFEKAFYQQYDYQVDYVGNPIVEQVRVHTTNSKFLVTNNLQHRPIIALLPGSRLQEVKQILPTMLAIVPSLPEYQFVVVGVAEIPTELYAQANKLPGVLVVYEAMYDVLENAYAAVVTSGTATLETACFQVPQVVVYKTNYFTYILAKLLVKVRYISLVNIIAGQEIVKELIQHQCRPKPLLQALQEILQEAEARQAQLAGYQDIQNLLGKSKAAKTTAHLMRHYLLKP